MNKLSCIIVDDEPLARNLLKEYISDLNEINLIGEFKSAIEARDFLKSSQVDVVFLDINMPKLSGIEFVRNLKTKALIVFTTAYPEFAVEAFEVQAFDYLVKPISFERFLMCVEKVKLEKSKNSEKQSQFITLKENKRLYKINLNDILHLEAYGDYVKVYTVEKVFLIKERLSNYEKLSADFFLRIHRSYIVNLRKIEFVEGNSVSINSIKIPIAQSYKDIFNKKFKT